MLKTHQNVIEVLTEELEKLNGDDLVLTPGEDRAESAATALTRRLELAGGWLPGKAAAEVARNATLRQKLEHVVTDLRARRIDSYSISRSDDHGAIEQIQARSKYEVYDFAAELLAGLLAA